MVISADKIPAQTQDRQPAIESEMTPAPIFDRDSYKGSDKLKGKVALITGGDAALVARLRCYMPKKVQMLRFLI